MKKQHGWILFVVITVVVLALVWAIQTKQIVLSPTDTVGTGLVQDQDEDRVDNEGTGSTATGTDTTGTGEFDPSAYNDPEIEELLKLLEDLVAEE